MKRTIAMGALAILTLSASTCSTLDAVVPGRAAIPVECREPKPERPPMPTELLDNDATVDAYVQAAGAEIKRREGYEGKLRTALDNCTTPIGSSK